MYGYAYPVYGYQDNNGSNFIWGILIVIFIIFLLFWGFGSNRGNRNCQ
ncbi:MAG: hypothetical protein J6J17_03535 [Bacilli bacterium]|nr:hypothetical protein [Bacilli bacterium]